MKEASEDFDKRRAIELKPLVDSFLKQKILQKAKKLNVWSVENNIFEPITITFSTCNKKKS